MAPRLSIVVPFFNVEPYIVSCLESLQRQSFTELEVILVDDGSRDASYELARQFARGDDRFRVVRQENQGLGPARNAGAAEAQGDFLAFVDSDDLVPRYAYERLVGSLDTTGSDIAAGDARRFNALGVWDSYAHRLPFATRRLATHMSEFPVLALDRMAWNKVYRREFWEANALEFPAMLYEDYPVTIKSHIRAGSVDVLPEPVYYWREREGGELSITQRHWELTNLRDRVVSAEMVLDLVDREAAYARETVQAHLFHIDVAALAAAVQEHPAEDAEDILELADRLCRRIAPEVRDRASAFERVQYHLLANRRIDLLSELIRYRAERGTSATVVRERGLRTRYYLNLPFFRDSAAGVPKSLYRVEPSEFSLVARVEDGAWVDGMLELELTAAPRMLRMGEDSEVSVWLENADGHRIPCQVSRHLQIRPHVGKDLSGLRTVINPHVFSGHGRAFWRLMVSVKTTDGLKRTGSVRSTAPTRGRWIEPRMLGKRRWMQPRIIDSDFGVWVGTRTQWVSRCVDLGHDVEISGALRAETPPDGAQLVLVRDQEAERRYPVSMTGGSGRVQEFTVRVPAADLVEHGEHDSPVEEPTFWMARLDVDGELRPLATHPDFVGAVSTLGHRSLMASRNPRGMFGILEGYAHPVTVDVRWIGRARLEIVGVTSDSDKLSSGLLLRRYVTPTQVVETPVDTCVKEGVFCFEVDVHDLIDRVDELAGSVNVEGRAATPWHIVSRDPENSVNFVMARDMAGSTAAPRRIRGHTVRVQIERGGVVRLLVD